jgi:AGCS family alanine or glycine:cation symporter
MQYLSIGLAAKGHKKFGRYLAIAFSLLAIGGSLGAGNAFQASQALGALSERVPFFQSYPIVFGIIMAVAVGFVIIGGITRIASTAEKIVPLMVVIYLLASMWILIANASEVPHAIGLIFSEAFAPTAAAGGLIGVPVQGFKRAAFSNEAGIGSAAIVHSTACVKYPVRQGMVALYEPFIDTIVICSMTALVIVTTGVYAPDGEFANLVASKQGAALTSAAYGTVISWFARLGHTVTHREHISSQRRHRAASARASSSVSRDVTAWKSRRRATGRWGLSTRSWRRPRRR